MKMQSFSSILNSFFFFCPKFLLCKRMQSRSFFCRISTVLLYFFLKYIRTLGFLKTNGFVGEDRHGLPVKCSILLKNCLILSLQRSNFWAQVLLLHHLAWDRKRVGHEACLFEFDFRAHSHLKQFWNKESWLNVHWFFFFFAGSLLSCGLENGSDAWSNDTDFYFERKKGSITVAV